MNPVNLDEVSSVDSFIGTNRQLKEIIVDVSGVTDETYNERKKHEHPSRAKEHDESGHSKISAHYCFNCNDAKKLSGVSVALLNKFPGIEKIDAMWITEIKQSVVLLTSVKNTILLG